MVLDQREEQLEELVLTLWRKRMEPGAVKATVGELMKVVKDPAALDAVEFYLPQFAHMIVQLGGDIPDISELEKFVLAACQMSIHVALQFFWIVYASLQEHRPKRGGNRGIYTRCARLLLHLEQCVAYGVTVSTERSTDQTQLMEECAKMAAESMSSPGTGTSDEAVYSGQLWKKGGGTSKLGRRSWHRRWFDVRQRVLYYYASEAEMRQRKPKGSIYLSSAELVYGKESKYENFFEVHCRQSDLRFYLRADGPNDFKAWVTLLKAVMVLPEPPGVAASEMKELVNSTAAATELTNAASFDVANRSLFSKYLEKSSKLSSRTTSIADDAAPPSVASGGSTVSAASGDGGNFTQRHEYFQSQRDFVRRLTDLAELLRGMAEEERQPQLQPALASMPMPPMTFFPLGHSSAKMLKVLRFAPFESIVFHTKARCPLMLFLEVQELETSVATALRTGSLMEPDLLTGKASGKDAAPPPSTVHAETLDLTSRKREGWAAKVERVGKQSELKASTPGWKLTSMFVKSNDDLRQEVFVMQMITFCQHIFSPENSWFATYHIQATGPDTGLIETITSAQDLDRLKKAPGYTTLRQLFVSRYGPADSDGFKKAQAEFSRSLAGYSILMWLLLLRDRHNANLMLDDDGHYFHVDFGFVLGHSTGKQIGGLVECSAFKMTAEYVELLDGLDSPVFEKFCAQCVANLREARKHGETICTLVEVVGTNSVFPCFQVVPVSKVMPRLRERLYLGRSDADFETEAMKMVKGAAMHWGSRKYDYFQNMQRGIAV